VRYAGLEFVSTSAEFCRPRTHPTLPVLTKMRCTRLLFSFPLSVRDRMKAVARARTRRVLGEAMPIQNIPNSIHILRARLRSLARPSVWLSALGVALVLGVGWEYAKRIRDREPNAEADAETEQSQDLSQLNGEVSEENAQIAAEIDSSDVLSDLLAQETPLPVIVEMPKDREEQQNTVQRWLDIIDRASPSPAGAPTASENNSVPNLFATSFTQPNASEDGEEDSTFDLLNLNWSTPTTAEAEGEPANWLQLNFERNVGGTTAVERDRSTDASSTTTTNPRLREESENATSETETDGRATSAETIPAFATPPPFESSIENPTNVGIPFTGYPYTPSTPGGTAADANSNPYALPSTGTLQPSPANPSASPSVPTYRRPSYDATLPTTSDSVNPYGNLNVNPSGNAPVNSFGTPSAPNAVGYPNVAPQDPNQYVITNPQPQPFSIPNTPPGRTIGNGEINTFANP